MPILISTYLDKASNNDLTFERQKRYLKKGNDECEKDPMCLFAYLEFSGWKYVSEIMKKECRKVGITNIDAFTPDEIAQALTIENAVIYKGLLSLSVNYIGFLSK